jgi:hypothetical protein
MLEMQLRHSSFQLVDCFARLSTGHDFFEAKADES